MTRCTTRIAGLGAGALLALGIFSAPAGASDGAQADATVAVETADAINQTLDVVNQACLEASQAGETAASALASEHGISVTARPAGGAVKLQVSLPALTKSLPSLGSLPLLGSASGQVDASEPLEISCATSTDGAGLGLSAAGVDVLVDAIAPGVDVSGLDLDIPAVDASVSANTSGSTGTGTTSVSATAAGSLPGAKAGLAPSGRVSAAAPAATTTTPAAAATDASASPASTTVSGGTLARTGAGLGALGVLGSALIGSGRLLGLGRKLFKIG